MTNRNWLGKATITGAALVLIAAMAFTACSKKEGGSGGGSTSASVGKASPASDFSYELTADKSGVSITGYTGNGGRVVIPATIEDMPVKEIGFQAFRGGENRGDERKANRITEIVIPDSVVKIEDGAFAGIENLTKATLPNGLKVIPNQLFLGCKNLTTVNLPTSLEVIEDSIAFANCGELNNLIIPESLNSVKFPAPFGSNNAFISCGKLPLATRAKIEAWGYEDGF